jgi:hypothetical protein
MEERGGSINRHCICDRREEHESRKEHHAKSLTDHGDPPWRLIAFAKTVPVAGLLDSEHLGDYRGGGQVGCPHGASGSPELPEPPPTSGGRKQARGLCQLRWTISTSET